MGILKDLVSRDLNSADNLQKEYMPDMHCPALPQPGLNFWKRSCQIKQQMPEHKRTCYPTCQYCKGSYYAPANTKINIRTALESGKLFLEEYRKGSTYAEIAELHGMSPTTVRRYINMVIPNKTSSPNKKASKEEIEQWKNMRKQGKTLKQIANLAGYAESTIYSHLHKSETSLERLAKQRKLYAKIVAFRLEGKTFEFIQNELYVSRTTVRRALAQHKQKMYNSIENKP